MHMKKISVIGRLYWEQRCCSRRLYRFIYPKTKVCLCPLTRRKPATAAITARRRLQCLLVHPVGRRPSSSSQRIGRPATPSGMSASKPGRLRRRPPSIISRSRLQRKGPASGLFLIYCTSLLNETVKLSVEDLHALRQLNRTQKEALAASNTRAP